MIQVGIDKVRLNTPLYTVKSLNGWSKKGGDTIGEAPAQWLTTSTGERIEGTGFYLNTPLVNADLTPNGLLINFNPSKVRHNYKLNTDIQDVGRIGFEVQELLAANGVLTNITDAPCTRLDFTKDAELSRPIAMYSGACNYLKGFRMKGIEYPNGYRFGNSQRQTMLYNKTAEVKQFQKIDIPEQITRLEFRLLKKKPLQKQTGLNTFGHVLKADPEYLNELYRKGLYDSIFYTPKKAVQMCLNLDTEQDIAKQYIETGSRAMERYLFDMHGAASFEALGGEDVIRELFTRAGMNERTARRQISKIKTTIQKAGFLNERRNSEAVNVHTLVQELKQVYAA